MIKLTVFPADAGADRCNRGELIEVPNFQSLAKTVTESPWAPGRFRGNYRKNENFMSCDFIALDVDGGCSLGEALNKHFKGLSYIIYTSRNHLKEKNGEPARDRFRVILPLDRPILNIREYRATWDSLYKRFPFIDANAKDAARFFFPGKLQSVNTEGTVTKVITNLSRKTSTFLTVGAPAGEWNPTLYRAAKDMQQQEYTEEQAIEMLELATKTPGAYGYLDATDMSTISSAFSTAPKHPPRETLVAMEYDEEGNPKLDYKQVIREVIEPYFLHHISLDMTTLYSITDPMFRELLMCKNEDVLTAHITKELEDMGLQGKPKLPASLVNVWKFSTTSLQETPKPFGWPAESGWVIRRLRFMPEAGSYNSWDEFLSRLSDKEAFMAFVWSCFEMKNKSRQALWIYGPEGQDGKSTVLAVLSECFGNASAALNNSQISSGSRFTLMNFFNKRLVVYPDAKNTKFPMTELFRNLTSGDVVPIEFKGGEIINTRLYTKLIIASNSEPEITSGNADSSRLLRLDLSPSKTKDDGDWEDRLREELPYFLHACSEVYSRLCVNNGQIKASAATLQLVQDSAEEFQEHLQMFFDKHFTLDPEGSIRATELQEVLKVEGLTHYEMKDFKDYLKTKLKITKPNQRLPDGTRARVYLGMTAKQRVAKTFIHKVVS